MRVQFLRPGGEEKKTLDDRLTIASVHGNFGSMFALAGLRHRQRVSENWIDHEHDYPEPLSLNALPTRVALHANAFLQFMETIEIIACSFSVRRQYWAMTLKFRAFGAYVKRREGAHIASRLSPELMKM